MSSEAGPRALVARSNNKTPRRNSLLPILLVSVQEGADGASGSGAAGSKLNKDGTPFGGSVKSSNLISRNLKVLRDLARAEKRRKKKQTLLDNRPEGLTWVTEVEKRKKKLMDEGEYLIRNHVNYRFQSDIAGQLVQDRMISESRKDKQNRGRSMLKTFSLGKGFSSMGPHGIMGSLKPLFHTLDVIDLSNQCIGKQGCRQLSEFIRMRDCHVVVLRMQRSQLTDSSLATLCKGLQSNESITTLDLAHNSMSHEAFTAMGDVLPFNSVLKELKVSWNNCHGRGLFSLSKGLLNNKSVKRLDLSWNLLSRERQELTAGTMLDDDTEAAITVFASLLRKNRGLRHLDLSNCSLSPRHASILADAFNNNHGITGFHYDGNAGLLDPKGFIRVSMEQSDVLSGASRLGCDPIKAASMFNQCWECKCWVEVTFFFRTEQWAKHHSTDVPQRMFLHLSIDQWKADLMALTPEGNFITHRMLPPGRTWFFFSEDNRVLLGPDQPMAFHPRLNLQRNYVDVDKTDVFQGYRRVKFRDTPCVEPPEKSGLALVAAEWDPLRSAFTYRVKVQHGLFDSDEVVTRAIRKDVEYTKLIKMKVVEEEEAQRMCTELASVYGILARVYQQYAAADPEEEPYELFWDGFLKFCMDHNIVDERVTVKEIGRIFLVTNVELETGAMNDADTLTRFEFFEMLVRVSLFKYEADKMRPGPAVSRLYHECIVDHVTDRALLDNDYFRYTCLYTQPVGRVLHRFEDKLRRVFLDYSTGKAKAKLKQSHRQQQQQLTLQMTMEDWVIYLYEIRVLRHDREGEFSLLDARKIFFRSKLLVEDEQSTNMHMLLSFPDFLEALTRLLCIPAVVTVVVLKRRLNEGGTFESLLEHFLEYVINSVYFIDLSTNKLLRKFPSCRTLPPPEQDRITFPCVREILRRAREKPAPPPPPPPPAMSPRSDS